MIFLTITSVIVFLLFSRSKRLYNWRYFGMILVSFFVALVVTLISLLIIGGAFGYWFSQFEKPWLNMRDGEFWQFPIPFSFPLTITVTCHYAVYPEIYIPEHPLVILQYQLYFYTLKMADIYDLSSMGLQKFLSPFLIFFQLLGLVVGIIITSFYEVFFKR